MDEAAAPPEDLIELKARWYVLKAECDRIAAQEPAGDFLRGSYQARALSAEQSARLEAARARLRELTIEVARHPWKGRQPDRNAAERALNQAARSRADHAEHPDRTEPSDRTGVTEHPDRADRTGPSDRADRKDR